MKSEFYKRFCQILASEQGIDIDKLAVMLGYEQRNFKSCLKYKGSIKFSVFKKALSVIPKEYHLELIQLVIDDFSETTELDIKLSQIPDRQLKMGLLKLCLSI